jgi:hypothetical protein
MHPTGAMLVGKYALQLSYQADSGQEKTGWLGTKQVNGKDLAFFVQENESLVLEQIQYIEQNYYRMSGAPETEHCQQHLYLSIVEDGNKNKKVGFSGCWGAAGWNLEQFTPRWFAGEIDKNKKCDSKKDYDDYQDEIREKKPGETLIWMPAGLPTGKRLSLDNGDTSKPLICLCDPPRPKPGDCPGERDKLDKSVLTVKPVNRSGS